MNKKEYEDLIHIVPDFPKPGIVFKDFSPLLKHKLPEIIEDMGKDINWSEIDVILGIESRGFILGSALAMKYNKGFVPVRKKGKLPPPIVSETYALEYGTDTLEMRLNDEKLNAIIVDDVIATGGTLKATIKLCEKNNYVVKGVSALIDLKFLNNLSESDYRIHTVLNY
jgi:adenine phosphoribosyltransferase